MSIRGDDQIKVEPQLKRASILLSHLLGFLTGNIFIFSLWVAENPEVGNIHPCTYASKMSLLDR